MQLPNPEKGYSQIIIIGLVLVALVLFVIFVINSGKSDNSNQSVSQSPPAYNNPSSYDQ